MSIHAESPKAKAFLASLLLLAVGAVTFAAIAHSSRGARVAAGIARPRMASTMSQRGRMANMMVNRNMDVRNAIPSSLGSKCVRVNEVATLCGKMVHLRVPTAVRAEQTAEESTLDADKLIEDITGKLNSIENKGQAAIYAGASVLAVLVANGLVTTIDAIPLLPYLMKLVGTGYSSWFIYRYLLFDDSRKELLEDLEAIRKKVTGEAEAENS